MCVRGRDGEAVLPFRPVLFEFLNKNITSVIFRGNVPKCILQDNLIIYSLSQPCFYMPRATSNGWNQKGLEVMLGDV